LKELGEIDYAKCKFPKHEEGEPGDGKVYTNDEGKLCMIDKAGRTYLIRADGTRASNNEKRNNSRPLGYQIDEWARLSNKEKDRIRDDIARKVKGDIPKAPHMRLVNGEDLGTGGASSSAGAAVQSFMRDSCTGVIDSRIPWKQPCDISDFYDNCGTEDVEQTSAGESDDVCDLVSDDSSWDASSDEETRSERSGNACIAAGPTFWMKDRKVIMRDCKR
jgi:hypothetical protein